jgi:hypothetical protein
MHGQQQPGGKSKKQLSDSNQPVAQPPNQTMVWFEPQKPEKTTQDAQGNAAKPGSYLKSLVAPQNLPQIILAVVGIVGVIVAIRTLKGIERQAKANEDTLIEIRSAAAQTDRMIGHAETQAATGKESLELTRDTAKRQLRAYVAVRDAKVIFHEDGMLEASLKLHNCGQTPAYELKGAHKAGFSHYPIPDLGTPPADVRRSVSLVGADNSFYILSPLTQLKGATIEQAIDELGRPNSVFFLAGHFTYRDVFEDEHFIRFQLVLGGPSGPLRWDTDEKGVTFAVLCNDSAGNEAD